MRGHAITARSQELTKNLSNTRLQLDNHFKSIKRREASFKTAKLVNFDEELKAKARLTRGITVEPGRSSVASDADSRATSSGPPKNLSRSYSSPETLFPSEWGGHLAMPKPPGSPAAFPLAVGRFCADVPACQHPPPHPGAHSMKPAQTRSMAAFATSHTAGFGYGPTSPPSASTALNSSPLPCCSTGLCALPPRRQPGLDRSSTTFEDLDRNLAAIDADGEKEKDPMISRLGHLMALLGPRYKCVSKELMWEKAKRGDRTPIERRLDKFGGIVNLGGGPDRLRPSGSAPGENDSDGTARVAWLEARTAERERRNQAARGNGR